MAKVEKTVGRIYDLKEGYDVDLVGSTSSQPTLVSIKDLDGNIVYNIQYQMRSPVLAQISDKVEAVNPGIYFSSSELQLVKASLDDPKISDGAYVIDDQGNALLAISSEGQIAFLQG